MNISAFYEAAGKGQYELIKQYTATHQIKSDVWVCGFASSGGHIQVLRWLLDNGFAADKSTISIAAESGHLNIIKLLVEFDCKPDSLAFVYAAYGGYIDIMDWLSEYGCPAPVWDYLMLDSILIHKHYNVIEWIISHNHSYDTSYLKSNYSSNLLKFPAV